MTNLPISQELADKLKDVARQQNRPLEDMLAAWLTQLTTNDDSAVRAVTLRTYDRARRYWQRIGDERQHLSDAQLDEQFWCIDPDGIPRLKADQASITLPPDPLLSMLEAVEAEPSQWSFGVSDIVQRSRDILSDEYTQHLLTRLNRTHE